MKYEPLRSRGRNIPENMINIMFDDALAPCITRTSVDMALKM